MKLNLFYGRWVNKNLVAQLQSGKLLSQQHEEEILTTEVTQTDKNESYKMFRMYYHTSKLVNDQD